MSKKPKNKTKSMTKAEERLLLMFDQEEEKVTNAVKNFYDEGALVLCNI